jgi:hypothetical protein
LLLLVLTYIPRRRGQIKEFHVEEAKGAGAREGLILLHQTIREGLTGIAFSAPPQLLSLRTCEPAFIL